MAIARFSNNSPGRRALIQLARVAALSSALAVIGGIVISDVIAAEPELEAEAEADAEALFDETFEIPTELDGVVELDWADDRGGPLALTTRYGMPDAPKVAVKQKDGPGMGLAALAVEINLGLVDGAPPVADERAAKEAAGVKTKPKRKRKRGKKKRRRGKKFKFGHMDAY